jgi:hypothetical protein
MSRVVGRLIWWAIVAFMAYAVLFGPPPSDDADRCPDGIGYCPQGEDPARF